LSKSRVVYFKIDPLEAFKEKALNPKNSHLTLLELAYDSGFNSKSVFNAFFKKMESCVVVYLAVNS
jgi:AraC-like DNA-binding protein